MIVGVCGSPRNQATEYVLKKALAMLEESGFETCFFTVRGKKLGFCTHCDYCLKNKGCVINDDMEEVYDLFSKAEGIVIATPVYNGGLSAQVKSVMDRCRALVVGDRDFFRQKIGMAIAVGGDRMGGQEQAIQQILTFYIINGMVPVSGGFFGANLGATFWSKDTLAGVREDEEGFRSLKKTVKRFARCMRKPEPEEKG
ncbi:MAG: flavodoxin family protein [Candidatus Bathyarchaeia archaeon]